MKLLECSKDPTTSRLADRLVDSGFYNRLIDQMSVRNLALSGQSGHDQFFSDFRTFGPISRLRIGEAVAEIATRAAQQRTYCLELMVSVQNYDVRELGRQIEPGMDHASMYRHLLDPSSDFDELLAKERSELGVGSSSRPA